MKKLTKLAWAIVLALGVYGIVHAANTYRRETVGGTQIYLLQSDGTTTQSGSLKLGSDATTPALPTTSNGSNFGLKVPIYNVGTAVAAGAVLCSSNTGTGYVSACGTTATSVIGVADAAIAATSYGYAVVGGYAVVLTTAVVSIGDILISTSATAGYAQKNNQAGAGTIVGVAVSAEATGTGPVVVRIK